MRDTAPQGTYKVQALDRAFAVWICLGESEIPLGLAQVASSLQLHKSTAHRFLDGAGTAPHGGADDERKVPARAAAVRLRQPRD